MVYYVVVCLYTNLIYFFCSSLSNSSGHTGYSSEEEEEPAIEPIVDLDVALERALGELDSVCSLETESNVLNSSVVTSNRNHGSTGSSNCSVLGNELLSLPASAVNSCEDDGLEACPPPTKKLKGRVRKHSCVVDCTPSSHRTGADIPDPTFNFSELIDFDVTIF